MKHFYTHLYFCSMASALGVDIDEKGKSSFEHILRQEAKFDADFLFSLDFFDGKMVRDSLNFICFDGI